MLDRKVSINGKIFGYHEISMLECVPKDHITITVESWDSVKNKNNGEMPTDSYYEIPWSEEYSIICDDIESDLWNSNSFMEHVDSTDELEEMRNQLADKEATIKAMQSLLTSSQKASLNSLVNDFKNKNI